MATEKDDKPKRDFRQDLTNKIVELVQNGASPWQKPWNPDAASAFFEMPHNAATGRAYRGGNAVWLMTQAMEFDSTDPRWCTFNQAVAEGWKVRKGSKGTTVEYWKFEGREEREDLVSGQKQMVTVKLSTPRVFYATVFHASQLEGIPEYQRRERPENWDPVLEAERILAGSGARIFHDQQDRAYYSPSADDIHLPPQVAFPTPLDYYEVAMHELGHWTGHGSRLARDLTGSFGSESYAREELRAQMASLYLSADLGVPFNPERHAAYQASWVKKLQEDKHEIFRAARDAEVIADYVLNLAREHTIEQVVEQAATQEIEVKPLEQELPELEAAAQWKLSSIGTADGQYGFTQWRNGVAALGEPSTVFERLLFDTRQERDQEIVRRFSISEASNEATDEAYPKTQAAIIIEAQRRVAAVPLLEKMAGPAYVFGRFAADAIRAAGPDHGDVNWRQVEQATIKQCIVEHGQAPESVFAALCRNSPWAITEKQQNALDERIQDVLQECQNGSSQSRESLSELTH